MAEDFSLYLAVMAHAQRLKESRVKGRGDDDQFEQDHHQAKDNGERCDLVFGNDRNQGWQRRAFADADAEEGDKEHSRQYTTGDAGECTISREDNILQSDLTDNLTAA